MPDPIAPTPPPQAPPPPLPKQKRGCWFYGCVTLVILGVIGGVGLYFSARYVIKSASGLAEHYTSTTPAPIETVSISQTDLKSLQERIASFAQAMDNQKGSREIVLTAFDINAMIQNDPSYRDAKGKLFVMLDGEQVKANISMPLDDIGPLKLKGRYLNGTAAVTVSLENGVLNVRLKDVDVGGKPLPTAIMTAFKDINFAQNLEKDPNASQALRKLESIVVRDNKVFLRAKEPGK
jgi:hypothetical protein